MVVSDNLKSASLKITVSQKDTLGKNLWIAISYLPPVYQWTLHNLLKDIEYTWNNRCGFTDGVLIKPWTEIGSNEKCY